MGGEEFEDLTTLFRRLQNELGPAGIGQKTSLEDQFCCVEDELRPLFVNTENLSSCLGVGGLTYEHAFLKKTEQWSLPNLSILLAEYRDAQKTNSTQLFAELANSTHINNAYKHVVFIAELEADKANMKAPVFVKSCLRDMGDLIESCLFPFVRLRLKVLEIDGKFNAINRRIEEFSLGVLLAEISRFDPGLYNPQPFCVSLSQWRNISHHSSFNVVGETIHCEYGKYPHMQRFECTLEQLVQICRYVDSVYYLHKVAFEIFCVDNIHTLQGIMGENGTQHELSTFSSDATLAYSILACGFRILNAGRKGPKWMLALCDRHNRSKKDIKIALQECLIPYLIQKGSTEIDAWVDSQQKQHFISFRGEMRSSTELMGKEYCPIKIDKNFRVKGLLKNNL